MKIKNIFATSMIIASSFVFASEKTISINDDHWAIQGALVTGGASIGIAHYSENAEFGATIAGMYNNGYDITSSVTPTIFAGWRKSLFEQSYFALGLNLGTDFLSNDHTEVFVGPYISLEKMLTSRILLSGWINPYQYSHTNHGISTNQFFNAGGIGLSYFFS